MAELVRVSSLIDHHKLPLVELLSSHRQCLASSSSSATGDRQAGRETAARLERACEALVADLRKIGARLPPKEAAAAKTSLLTTANQLVIAAGNLKAAWAMESGTGREEEFSMKIASTLKELYDICSGVSVGPAPVKSTSSSSILSPSPPLSKLSTPPNSNTTLLQGAKQLSSPSIANPTFVASMSEEFLHDFQFTVEQWTVFKDGVYNCMEQMIIAIDSGNKDEYEFIVECIDEQVDELLMDVNELDMNAFNSEYRLHFQQQVYQLSEEMTALTAAGKVASGAWPPTGAEDAMRLATAKVMQCVKGLVNDARSTAKANLEYMEKRNRMKELVATNMASKHQEGNTTLVGVPSSPPSSVLKSKSEPEIPHTHSHASATVDAPPPAPGGESLERTLYHPAAGTPLPDSSGLAMPGSPVSVPTSPLSPSSIARYLEQRLQHGPPKTSPSADSDNGPPKPAPLVHSESDRSITTQRKLHRASNARSFFLPSKPKTEKAPLQRKQSSEIDLTQEQLDCLIKIEERYFPDDNLVFNDSNKNAEVSNVKTIKHGSLEKLVERLTWHRNKDSIFVAIFLHTYQSFTTPGDLLLLLEKRYDITTPPDLEPKLADAFENVLIPQVRHRVGSFLQSWIEKYPGDFDGIIRQLELFINGQINEHDRPRAESLRRALIEIDKKKNLRFISRTGGKANRVPATPDAATDSDVSSRLPKPPEPLITKPLALTADLLDVKQVELARQITLRDSKLYKAIQLKELLNQSWNDYKKAAKPEEAAQMKNNVNRIIDSFNEMGQWVATEVVNGSNEKIRGAVIKYFIGLGKALRDLQNFNALMAIVAGLNGSAVYRLKKSWEQLSKEKRAEWEELQSLMSQQNNYANLRNTLKFAETDCIPYLGMYLTDLTFLEDGNKDKVNGLINIEKRRKLSLVIFAIEKFQNHEYNFKPLPDVQHYIDNRFGTSLSEDDAYKASMKAEPRT